MAVPKRKTSPAKRGMRRANQGLSSINHIACDNCNEMKLSHCVCKHCGMYKGMQVVKIRKSSESEDQENIE